MKFSLSVAPFCLCAIAFIELRAQEAIFTDEFKNQQVDAEPSSPWLSGSNRENASQTIELDGKNLFGEGVEGRLLHIVDFSDANGTRIAGSGFAARVITLSFSFYEPADSAGAPLVIRTGRFAGGVDSDTNTVASVLIGDGLRELSDDSAAYPGVLIKATNAPSAKDPYQLNSVHRMDIVLNNSDAPIEEYAPSSSVEPGSFDVWVDGNRVIRGARFSKGITGQNDDLTDFVFRTYARDLRQEIYIKSVRVFNGAHVGLPLTPGGGLDSEASSGTASSR